MAIFLMGVEIFREQIFYGVLLLLFPFKTELRKLHYFYYLLGM